MIDQFFSPKVLKRRILAHWAATSTALLRFLGARLQNEHGET